MGSSSSDNDSYEDQLRSLFNSCTQNNENYLTPNHSLLKLCRKLELSEEQRRALTQHRLLDSKNKIYFKDFKEGLVAMLEEDLAKAEKNESFKKRYGRRSRRNSAEKEFEDSCHQEPFNISPNNQIHNDSHQQLSFVEVEEKYLKSLLHKYGIHQEGFIDFHDLSMIYNTLGLDESTADEVANKTLAIIGEDINGQTLISVKKLLSSSCQDSRILSESPIIFDPLTNMSKVSNNQLARGRDCGRSPISIFSAIDVNGFSSLEVLLQYWFSLGITNGQLILSDLGLCYKKNFRSIDLRNLSSILNDELEQCKELTGLMTVKAGLASVQNEIRFLRTNLDNLNLERDKLKVDLNEANLRASLLATEIDEQHARTDYNSRNRIKEIETRYIEQIKEIQGLQSKEREMSALLNKELELKLQVISSQIVEQEGKLKEELLTLKSENEKLERENQNLENVLCETNTYNSVLLKEIESLSEMTEKLRELDSSASSASKSLSSLQRDHQELTLINKGLKDTNDELLSQIEAYKVELLERRGSSRRNSAVDSSISESLERFRKSPSSSSSLGAELADFQSTIDLLSSSSHSSLNLHQVDESLDNQFNSSVTETVTCEETLSETLDMNILSSRSFIERSSESRLEKQGSKDEERIFQLTSKCSKLEERLRDSLSNSSLENIQVISIRNISNSSISGSADHVSKILVNTEESSNIPSSTSSVLTRVHENHSRSPSCEEEEEEQNKYIGQLSNGALKRSRSTNDKASVFPWEFTPKNLEGELEDVKEKILKILSDKSNTRLENESLKRYAEAYCVLERENKELKRSLKEFVESRVQVEKSILKSDRHLVDRSSPDGQEFFSSSHLPVVFSHNKDSSLKTNESEVVVVLEAKVSELENSLELMKNEFDKMEDYWTSKIHSERLFYEKQVCSSENNCKDLEIKMKEYEELLMASEKLGNSSEADKLSTIQESLSLEYQVTELEDELQTLSEKLKALSETKDQEIKDLNQIWKKKLENESNMLMKEKKILEIKNQELEIELSRLKGQLGQVHWHQSPEGFGTLNCENKLSRLRQMALSSCHGTFNSSSFMNQFLSSGSLSLEASWRFSEESSSSSSVKDSLVDSTSRLIQDTYQDINKEKNYISNELQSASKSKNTIIESLSEKERNCQNRLLTLRERCNHLKESLNTQEAYIEDKLNSLENDHTKSLEGFESLTLYIQRIYNETFVQYNKNLKLLLESQLRVQETLNANEELTQGIIDLIKYLDSPQPILL